MQQRTADLFSGPLSDMPLLSLMFIADVKGIGRGSSVLRSGNPNSTKFMASFLLKKKNPVIFCMFRGFRLWVQAGGQGCVKGKVSGVLL